MPPRTTSPALHRLFLLPLLLLPACSTPPQTPPTPPPPAVQLPSQPRPYPAEQTVGDTRVVLLRVSRSTLFSAEFLQSNPANQVHAIPEISVELLVEHLGPETKIMQIPNIQFYANGQPLTPLPNLIGGGSGESLPYDPSLPKVSNSQKATLHRETFRGLIPPSPTLDLHLQTGPADHPQHFIFRNIPLY